MTLTKYRIAQPTCTPPPPSICCWWIHWVISTSDHSSDRRCQILYCAFHRTVVSRLAPWCGQILDREWERRAEHVRLADSASPSSFGLLSFCRDPSMAFLSRFRRLRLVSLPIPLLLIYCFSFCTNEFLSRVNLVVDLCLDQACLQLTVLRLLSSRHISSTPSTIFDPTCISFWHHRPPSHLYILFPSSSLPFILTGILHPSFCFLFKKKELLPFIDISIPILGIIIKHSSCPVYTGPWLFLHLIPGDMFPRQY